MRDRKRTLLLAVKAGIVLGFLGIGVFGLGLMVAVFWYPTTLFWTVIIFLMGGLGVLLAVGVVGAYLEDLPEIPGVEGRLGWR